MPSFAELTAAFLHEEYEDLPVRASSLGLTDCDDRLDDLSEAFITRRASRDAHWLEQFRAIGDDQLSADEAIVG